MINTSTLFDHHTMIMQQEKHQLKIQELQKMVENLKEEIKILKDIQDRMYDV